MSTNSCILLSDYVTIRSPANGWPWSCCIKLTGLDSVLQRAIEWIFPEQFLGCFNYLQFFFRSVDVGKITQTSAQKLSVNRCVYI